MLSDEGNEPTTAGAVAHMVEVLRASAPVTAPAEVLRELLELQPELSAVDVTELSIDGPNGRTAARLYRRPNSTPTSALVWVHGGGFVTGNLDIAEASWVGLALAEQGIPVLSLDYRKAVDGTHFPIPSNDVLAGWQWAVDNADVFGVDAAALHLGGASAGGNLTEGVTKRLLASGGTLPASVVLAYPALHATLPPWEDQTTQARLDAARAFLFPESFSYLCLLNYVGEEPLLANPYAVPANGDVDPGHPPTLVVHCEWDVLRRSSEPYARALVDAGVIVQEVLEPKALHGSLSRPAEDGPRTIENIANWMRRDASA
ncbi:alpha/beta hydrolase [Arthrobacter sp. efr-133-TYG-118]|uniref:alpha/beta hydrolase n=1 Tax=Arthrobacter sp. efr-133-TYG-118 TaxID=3040279 RepID=UPI00254F6541|nr:alpha/beta hydrolase [Arthrobacter sp. efr-133-TYG-118]